MATINLYNEGASSATYVPNIFIDDYMTQANGEYVKIYLYLLRCVNQPQIRFSLSLIADHFDCTERDVLRALKYWEKLGLFRLEYSDSNTLSGICFLTDLCVRKDASSYNPSDNMHQSQNFITADTSDKKTYSANDIDNFKEKDDIRELVFITEQYLGRTLNQTDLNALLFWYDELHFGTDLIEYIVETCVSKGHKSLHYMQKIAEDFHARGINTVTLAKEVLSKDTALFHAVMKAFGIRGRNLAPSEIAYLKSWSDKMGFEIDVISEACNRTISNIHEPSFGYANTILENWHAAGIKDMTGIKEADARFISKQTAQTSRKVSSGNTKKFANFKQRENNYDDLQAQLVRSSLQ